MLCSTGCHRWVVPSALYLVVYEALKVLKCAYVIAIPRRNDSLHKIQWKSGKTLSLALVAIPLTTKPFMFCSQLNRIVFPPTSFLFILHVLLRQWPISPTKMSLSICFGRNAELIFILFPDLPSCSLKHIPVTTLWPSFWKNFTIQEFCAPECFAVWTGWFRAALITAVIQSVTKG